MSISTSRAPAFSSSPTASRTIAASSGPVCSKKNRSATPIVRPRTPAASASRYRGTGNGWVRGSRGDAPASTSSAAAASRTDRVIGPQWSSVGHSGLMPARLTRPKVGFSPTMPHTDAGQRIEPPVSVPGASATMPAATAAPDPPLDPPGTRLGSCGLRHVPYQGLSEVVPQASSCVLSFPMQTAPAPASSATTSASLSGTLSR